VRSSAASISGVRRITHTGWPRHSTTRTSPGAMVAGSMDTLAPWALARSLGAKLDASGTATAVTATAPMAPVASSQVRRSGSMSSAGGCGSV
jgi:hypothetical protein